MRKFLWIALVATLCLCQDASDPWTKSEVLEPSVLASLICQPTAPFTPSLTSLPGVLLPPSGDFEIHGMLWPVPPTPCASPMLLILNAANLTWFAVGIVRSGDD